MQYILRETLLTHCLRRNPTMTIHIISPEYCLLDQSLPPEPNVAPQ